MAKNLVIVESPAKSKTLKKYLGGDYEIMATYGHIRDLIPKEGAVEPDENFLMHYQLIEKNVKHVNSILTKLKKADNLLLATDPDREGEAISWHLAEIIREKGTFADKNIKRVTFYEITKKAVLDAVAGPRDLSMDLVNAQQARRALDYLVGFKLSPLLWKKIRRGLSAGRVQSPALRMIVEREEEIEKFERQEYWSLQASLEIKGEEFQAKLVSYEDEKLKQFSITDKEAATKAKKLLETAGKAGLKVAEVNKSQRKRNPQAPFTTSTLQQEGVRKLGFSTKKTMMTAQQLYEGVDIGEGQVGLITYMRTDSVNLAQEAVTSIREYIEQRYGKALLPDEPKVYKTKSKNAQEAHEAIRPTDITVLPEDIKNKVSTDQYKMYNLIWLRTIACQMLHATIDQVSVNLECGKGNIFRATGSTIAKPGFMQVYIEGSDDNKPPVNDTLLPPMQEGDIAALQKIDANQHFTEPPPRFSEASIVKALEEFGIGRPSTYASIISTLLNREYVSMDAKRFVPTDVGRVVNKFLTQYFTQYVDYDFTAKLEDLLDDIARGEKQWQPILGDFWLPFAQLIKHVQDNVSRADVTQEKMDESCPDCNKPLSVRLGRRGKFVGCTGYPDCRYTRSLDHDSKAQAEIIGDRKCPQCSCDLVIKTGKYGKFIGCSGYPDCRYIEPLDKPEDTGVNCPQCDKNTLFKRKSRQGNYFYSCNGYPDCKYIVKYPPVDQACPECKWPILMLRTTKRWGTELMCPQKECSYKKQMEEAS